MTKKYIIFLAVAIISIAHSSDTNDLEHWNRSNNKHLVTSLDNFVRDEIPISFDNLEIKKTLPLLATRVLNFNQNFFVYLTLLFFYFSCIP